MLGWRTLVRAVVSLAVAVATVPGGAVSASPLSSGDVATALSAAESVPLSVDQVDLVVDSGSPASRPPEPGDAPPSGPLADPDAGPVVADAQGASVAGRVETDPVEVSDVQTLGVTWPQDADVDGLDPQVRTREDGVWSDWSPLDSDIGPDAGTIDARTMRGGTDAVWIGDADAVQLSFAAVREGGPDDMRIALVRPTGEPTATVQPSAFIRSAAMRDAADPNAPAVITREAWGARPQACAPDVASGLVGAVLHHTAGSNSYSTLAQAMAQIRGDQAYHIDGRGWCDIGYNFVVDKWGNIYEGRAGSLTRPVIGVHAGGFNTGTVGVAMLGTYSTVAPPSVQLDAVARIIGYRLGAYGRNPNGMMSYHTLGGENSSVPPGTTLTMPVVFGHRDVAYTACPGNLGYAALPWIRAQAQRTAYAQPLVRQLYSDMLQREVDSSGLSSWSGALLGGVGPSWVADRIARSGEYAQRRIIESYRSILGRDPEPSGLTWWSAAVQQGGLRVEDLRGVLIVSDEYYVRAGGTDAAYIRALYRDLLRRGAADSEVASWTAQMAIGGRSAVATGVWRSIESARLRVDEAYRTYLGRSAEPGGLAGWAPYWQAYGEDALRGGLVGSDEYMARAAARFLVPA